MIRKFITFKDSWTWKGLIPFTPIVALDIGTILVRSFPALVSSFGLPADTILSAAFTVSVLAVNLAYVAFVRTMSK